MTNKGWTGLPEVKIDGNSWPLTFAAELLDFPEKDLRELIRITGLKPIGTIKTSDFARQGRNPRAYNASELVRLVNGIRELMVESSTELGTVTQVR